MQSRINPEGLALIKRFEGFRSKPYLDAVGIPTIGYGFTFYEDNSRVTMKDPEISMERAEIILIHLLSRFEDGVRAVVPQDISSNAFSALVSFAYNVGLANFRSSTLLKKLNAGDMQGAADQFLRWNKAGGKVLNGLTARRAAEMALFLTPDPEAQS